ncbi:MAG: hypothetical protein TEF_05935 [Rhizobiales bacterium NRL2]|jgi:UDP-N-acetylmuramoyl-tripeptide--D-alanyl-D-alanine ligase|nr:MAG: hypothetical protein TEF_05935 [Rhizobiales bacterium NRL2]
MIDLWHADEVAAATEGQAAGGWRAGGVSIDSRTVTAGDLFVALEGPNFDGHDYVEDALAKGAAAAMVHRAPAGADPARLVVVGDTLKGLQDLGRAARQRTSAKVLAVTGSAGKTGAKEALRHCLAACGVRVHASDKSFNNHWGVPLTLARMPRDAEYTVLELGMNHPGEISALVEMARPDVALVTTIAPAHMAAFESLDAIADAKAEIFERLGPDGAAVIPADLPQTARLTAAAKRAGAGRIVTFGAADAADVRLICAKVKADRSCVRADLAGVEATFCVGLPGEHWVMNALGVLAALQAAGADIGRAAPALARLRPLAGRGAREQVSMRGDRSFTLIDDSYNANPASMRAAFSVLGAAEPAGRGRRVAVLGDMLELGRETGRMHAGLADDLAESGVRLVFLCGPEMARLEAAMKDRAEVTHAPDSETLAPKVAAAVGDGDVVLVKGSLGSRMAVVVEALKSLGEGGRAAAARG